MKAVERDMIGLMAVSNMSTRAEASRHRHSVTNGLIDYGFNVAYANRDQKCRHESDVWPELYRSKVREMRIRRCPEIETQQLDIFSKRDPHLSINTGMIQHVQTLDFIPIGEESHVTQKIFLFRSTELDGSTVGEDKSAILNLLGKLIRRHIRIRSVVGGGFFSQLRAARRTSCFSMQNDRSLEAEDLWVRSVF
jgi:hypothetical protein